MAYQLVYDRLMGDIAGDGLMSVPVVLPPTRHQNQPWRFRKHHTWVAARALSLEMDLDICVSALPEQI